MRRRRRLVLRGRSLSLGSRTLVMGVINVTPDSFYDGGRYLDPGAALDRALQLAAEGADLLDLGAESTRPGSLGIAAAEEWRRIAPVLECLRPKTDLPLSIDTTKAEIAARSLGLGADLINDTSGLADDPALANAVAAAGAGLIVMHRRGRPRTMQRAPRYRDLLGEVTGTLRHSLAAARARGVRCDSLVADPGIGFGKTLRHNLRLLAGLRHLRRLGVPLLVGASRKSFIGRLTGDPPERRLEGSLAAAVIAASCGADLLRVHDVAATVRALRVVDAVRAEGRRG